MDVQKLVDNRVLIDMEMIDALSLSQSQSRVQESKKRSEFKNSASLLYILCELQVRKTVKCFLIITISCAHF